MTTIFSNPKSFSAEIVCEKKAISGLEDGKIYVLAERNDKFVNAVKTATQNFKKLMSKDGLIYPYDIIVLEDFNTISASGVLHNAVHDGVNLILPIFTPSEIAKQYIVAKSESALLDMYIPSMVMQAENLTKKAIEEALINLASQESEGFKQLFDDVKIDQLIFDDDNNDSLWVRILGGIGNICCGASLFSAAHGAYLVPPDTTYQQSREIMNRFVKNAKRVKRIENQSKISPEQLAEMQKAQSEIEYVFKLFNASVYTKFMQCFYLHNNIKIAFDNCINRDMIAAKSNIDVSVEYAKPEIDAKLDPKIANKIKTNGKFRVYLSNGKDTVQVKFTRTASCIVYIMYLMDRKQRGDNIDTIKISNNEKLFCQLYQKIYNATKEEALNKFKTLTTQKGDTIRQSRLSDCYSDIREALDKSVSEFGESSIPFYIPNKYSHITILSSKITIADVFKDMSLEY